MLRNKPDSEVLGRILLLQSTLHVMPTEEKIGDFICKGVSDIAGVSVATLCLEGIIVSRWPQDAKDIPELSQYYTVPEEHRQTISASVNSYPLGNSASIHAIPLSTTKHNYGSLLLQVESAEEFALYHPYLENTANLVALVIENRRQEADQRQFNIELERQVQEQTIHLAKANDALRDNEERVRLLLDSTAEAIYGLDLKGNCTFCNFACLRLLGFERPDQLLGKNMHVITHHTRSDGTPYPKKDCQIYEAFQRGKGTHVDDEIFWRADGSSFAAEYWSYPIVREDKIVGSVVTLLDITNRKLAEEELNNHRTHLEELVKARTNEIESANQALQESEERYRRIFEDSPISLWEEDFSAFKIYVDQLRAEGISDFRSYFETHPDAVIKAAALIKIVDINRATIDLYRVDNKSQFLGNLNQVFTESSHKAFREEIIAIAEGETTFEIESTNQTLAGDEIHISLKLSTAPGYEKTLSKVLVSINDITKLKKTEAEMYNAKVLAEGANRTKSIFLANMSHELRTPLNAVLGFSELMARDPQVSQKQSENLKIIKRSGEHLLALINDVLDMSKIEAGRTELELESIDLHLLLQDLGDMFRLRTNDKKLGFNLQLRHGLPRYVSIDAGKLRQVLINLLGNAVKFTEAGKVILRANANNLFDGNWQLRIEVEDTGVGIPAEKIEDIFKPFTQTGHLLANQQGTGLGLAISSQFIQLMGGTISVESMPNKGSVFHFEIPAKVADASEVVQPLEKTRQRIVGLATDEPEWRILIVEDEANNRLLLGQMLASVGFNIRYAANGEEAIHQFQDWHPQLIWMDMRMPVMDGYEATRCIRTLPNGEQTKILALTANAFKEQEKQILAAGCDAVLHKPYNEALIFKTMGEQLGLHYIYEGKDESPSQNSLPKLGIEDLQGLHDAWLMQFLRNAYMGDIETMLSLTKTLPATESETKVKLDHCINNFQFQHLIKTLEEKIGPTEKN